MKDWLKRAWIEYRTLLIFLLLMTLFRSAIADWNDVPTGSMKPTIIEGDRILVNKMAYDIRVPFTHVSLLKLADPQRGEIIIFDSAVSELRLVKRVIGVPGDVISMSDNVLTINGEQLAYRPAPEDIAYADKPALAEDSIEQLFEHEYIVRKLPNGRAANFPTLIVPPDFYFVMGDNRDNSADSRYIGFVPRHEVVGRSRSVVLSLDYDNYLRPRGDRFMHTL